MIQMADLLCGAVEPIQMQQSKMLFITNFGPNGDLWGVVFFLYSVKTTHQKEFIDHFSVSMHNAYQ